MAEQQQKDIATLTLEDLQTVRYHITLWKVTHMI